MDSLELVRKLYDGDVDPAALGRDLDETEREELRQLVEAKAALETLPRRRPSAGVIDAVLKEAAQSGKRPGALILLLSSQKFQRLAAAAIVVATVGIGYIALQTSGVGPVDENQPTVATEESAQFRQDVGQESMALREDDDAGSASSVDNKAASTRAGQIRRDAPAAPEPAAEMPHAFAEKREVAEPGRSRDGLDRLTPDVADEFAADIDMLLSDSVMEMEASSSEAHDFLSWDQEDEDLRTFFWQVRALDGRSPDEGWEEAVPLEGSFERLEKQQSDNHWLQTGSQR